MFGAGRVLYSGALAIALLAGMAPQALASGSAVAGWQVVATGESGVSSYSVVTPVSARDAWAAGSSSGQIVARHWDGRTWRASRLPAGLSGSIQVLSASAWNNVWAFGTGDHGSGGYALRYNGHRWLVMKRWPGSATSFSAVIVRSPRDLWAFSYVTGLVEHYDGNRWLRIQIVPYVRWFDSARILPDGQIWAIAEGPQVVTGTPKGTTYTWKATRLTGLPPSHTGGDVLTGICPLSARNVWALGGNVTTSGKTWYPLAAHWNGHAWARVRVTGSFTLAGGTSASDGHGGLWVTTGWDSTGVPPRLLHFAGGKFTTVHLPVRHRQALGVYGLADIPGTASAWGAGAWTGRGALGPATGTILRHGH